MTKIIISQLRVLPRFTDVYRHPLTVREKFGPAMIALDLALILVAGMVAPMAKRAGMLMLRDKAMKYAWKSLQLPVRASHA
jgi:hypothetical protein